MKNSVYFMLLSGLSVLFSSSAFAHITESGGSLLHAFTGEHLLTLALAGVFVVGVVKVYRRFR